MGFFSRSEVVYSSTSNKLYEDVPTLVSQSVAAAITQNRDLTSDLVTNLVNGIGYRANALYNYGLQSYPYGLPDGSVGLMPPDMYDNVQLVIQKEIGASIYLYSCVVDRNPVTSTLFYYASYQLLDSFGNIIDDTPIEWEYDEASEVYDILTIAKEDELGNSPYFPIMPVRIDGKSQVADDAEHRVAIKRAGNMIGVSISDIADAMDEGDEEDDTNPVEDAFVMLGVEVASTEQISLRYLHAFFTLMNDISTVKMEDYEYWLEAGKDVTPPINSILISDASYKMELGWLYIEKDIVEGVITDVTEFKSEYHANSGDVNLMNASGVYYSTSGMTFYHQINDTQYSSIYVHGLVHTNWAVGKELRTTLGNAFDEDNEDLAQCFIIPLRKDILNAIGTIHQHDLMYQSIRLVVNDRYKYKLKWYQTGFFKAFMMIVAIVISIFYPPFGIAAMSAAACGMAVVMVIAAKILLPIVYQALEDVIGEELALLVTVIASMWAGGFSLSSVINSAITAIEGIGSMYLEDALADITKELDDVYDLLEEQADEEAERQRDIDFTVGTAQADSFNILQASDYVTKSFYDIQEPTLIREMTQYYTDAMRYTDKPDSVIRLGQTL